MPHEISVHGTTVVAEYLGPPRLVNIPGQPWSEMFGFRRGWGTRFRGVAHSNNWFHYPVPTLIAQSGLGAIFPLLSVVVHFQTFGTSYVRSVHAWLGGQRVLQRDGLRIAGNYQDRIVEGETVFQVPGRPTAEPGYPLNISIGVEFGAQESEILFASAGASFG